MSRVVVKLGGRVAGEATEQARALVDGGHEVVVVHGAGPQISAELERLGIPVRFIDGRRVTDERTLEVVRRSLVDVGTEVAAALGAEAIALAGDEIGLEAELLPGLGLVGEPRPCRPPAIEALLARGRIPVVSPLAAGPLNVNADEAAAALAVGLEADRLLFISDVPGVYLDGVVAERIDASEAEELLDRGVFEGGIVPKLVAAVRAARCGVRAAIGVTEVAA
ncbi:MAG: acetylglutamate kinase [Thermoleophilia bacterium]|nr:acetylglutamate kinase [Gaiellaceae bacterium]MDW8337902.1 acetylglutamate kinase [Thermoleophilia bacterium]